MRRDSSRHRLVRNRLAVRLSILHLTLHRSAKDDFGFEERRLSHLAVATAVLRAEKQAFPRARGKEPCHTGCERKFALRRRGVGFFQPRRGRVVSSQTVESFANGRWC